jgi:CubicO group peptidase (beta-lactamase class C family)
MMLFEEGKFLLDDPISEYIPEFKNPKILKTFNEQDTTYTTEPANRGITVRQLLTHTSGIGYAIIGANRQMNAIYAKAGVPSGVGNIAGTLAEKMKILGTCPIMHEPGERFTYGLNTDLLGYLVEIWSGMSLNQFMKTRIFDPLGMKDTYFFLPKEKQPRLVKLYEENDGIAKKINTSVEGDADYPCGEGTYFSGGAGLSSTIEDYAKFLQMLLNGGTYNGKRLLARKTIDLILTNQISDKVSETRKFGLGFEIETASTDHRSPLSIGSFSWAGMFNTSYWADPSEKLVALIYAQIYPTTNGRIEHKFRALVYQALF